MNQPQCERCGRTHDWDNALEWEAADETGDTVICPECIAPSEQQAIDEDMMDLADTTPLDDESDPRLRGH